MAVDTTDIHKADKERFDKAKAASSKIEKTNDIAAEVREAFGKGAARKLRVLGKIPAVLYGHGSAPQHLSLPGHEVGLLLRKANAMINLHVAGKAQLALVKDVQKDPVLQIIEHIDLVIIRKGEKVQVEVPVYVVGEAAPGTALEQEEHTILVEASAISIPERVDVSVEGLEAVSHVYARDIILPEGTSLVDDADMLIASVVEPLTQDLGEIAEETEDDDAAEAAPTEESSE